MKKLTVIMMLSMSILLFGKDYSKYKTDKLISATQGKELIEKGKNIVVIDVRQPATYLLGNIPNSYNMWRPDMEAKDDRYGKITNMRGSRKEIEDELNKMGVTKDSTLVLIGNGLDKYKLWWILDMYGMDNVKIVDGGYDALKSTGIKTTIGKEKEEVRGNYHFPNIKEKDNVADFKEVKSATTDKNTILIDTRMKKEYTGETEAKGSYAAGRIPSAIWIEWTEAVNKDKTLKSYEELEKIYKFDKDKTIIPYCQVGVKSAHTYFVLKELLGYKAKNYDGSWLEWSYQVSNGNAQLEKGE